MILYCAIAVLALEEEKRIHFKVVHMYYFNRKENDLPCKDVKVTLV